MHGVNKLKIREFSNTLFCYTFLLQGYFTLAIIRDLSIFCVEFFSSDFLGFWKTMVFNLVCTPFDSLALLIMAANSYIALGKENEGLACEQDMECSESLEPVKTIIYFAFGYVAVNLGAKFCLLFLFMFGCGGFQMLAEDLHERDRFNQQFMNRRRII